MSRKKPPSLRTTQTVRQSHSSAVDLVMQLMAIPGQSGEEDHVVEFIRRQLRTAGASAGTPEQDSAHRRTPIDGKTGNLVLRLPGTFKAPRRLLMAHMDTVPICVGSQPRKVGRMVRSADPATGLGADDRAGVAVVLHTAMEILRRKLPHPPLTFLWTVQEEIGLQGARYARLGMLGKPKHAFNWDGGSPGKITIGATGGYRMEIEVGGLASHAGNAPEAGVSAIAISGVAIAELHRKGWHGSIRKRGKSGTSNVGVIQGGAATNVVTDRVVLQVEARSHDAEFRKEIVDRIESAFRSAVEQVRSVDDRKGRVRFRGRLDYESFRMDPEHPTVKAAEMAIRHVKLEPVTAITNGGLDANWMNERGIPTVSLGCGQRNQHMVTESLELTEFCKACEVARVLATHERLDD